MPFAVHLPFYPGHQPNLIFSREAEVSDYEGYLALAEQTTSLRVFDREVPAAGVVLDAGCGAGRWLVRLHDAGRRMIGLDLHSPVLARVHARRPAVPLVAGAVAALPFASGSLAAIISLGVVEHDESGPEASLGEFFRVLQPGGRLLLSVPLNNALRRTVVNHLYRRYNTRWAGRGYYFVEYRFTRREILAVLRRTGFRPLSCHPHDFLPPRSMGWIADRNMLSIRLEQRDGEMKLRLPEQSGWLLRGWRAWANRALHALSPWLTAAEILVVAEKAEKA
jgi:SAM-dependent methyltransferase